MLSFLKCSLFLFISFVLGIELNYCNIFFLGLSRFLFGLFFLFSFLWRRSERFLGVLLCFVFGILGIYCVL